MKQPTQAKTELPEDVVENQVRQFLANWHYRHLVSTPSDDESKNMIGVAMEALKITLREELLLAEQRGIEKGKQLEREKIREEVGKIKKHAEVNKNLHAWHSINFMEGMVEGSNLLLDSISEEKTK